MRRSVLGPVAQVIVCMWLLVTAPPARGQVTVEEGFEGPEPSWSDAGGDARDRILVRQRTHQGARTGAGCEYVQLDAGTNGTYVHLGHELRPARVIAELVPSVWIRADRSGLQILARVVLPRTADPRTGEPVSTLIEGASYTRAGAWEQLRVEGASRQLAEHARILRAELRTKVDTREAYIDRILLNAYGGQGSTRLWIDDLEVAGFVPASPPAPASSASAGSTAGSLGSGAAGERSAVGAHGPLDPLPPGVTAGHAERARVELAGSVLLVDGRPMFPRMIQYQGEPLGYLQRRGFNTVKLTSLPTEAVLEEAARHGMWLVCPPPRPAGLQAPDGPVASLGPIGARFDPVLAWDLGEGLNARDLDLARRWAEQIRRADGPAPRPVVCDPQTDLVAYSRVANLLVTHRFPLGTGFELTDYATWLRERPRLARPGTPFWTTIQTQLAFELRRQVAMFSSGSPPAVDAQSEQVRLLVYAAVAAGARGICFQSDAPLDGTDAASRARALALELVNLELKLIEPWAAGGSVVATVPGSVPEVFAAVLETDRTRLLLPMWAGRGAQLVPGQSAGNGVSFVIPGVPEADDAYEITPGGLRPLRHQRVTGGVRVTLDEFGLATLVLLTQDPLVVGSLTRQLADMAPRAARLQRDLAVHKFQQVRGVDGRLARLSRGVPQAGAWLAASQASLRSADGHAANGDYLALYLDSQRAMRPLRLLQRAHWQAAAGWLGSPLASPCALGFASLPEHWTLAADLGAAGPSASRLPEGDFEHLDRMLAAGWRHFQHPREGVLTDAELSPDLPHAGRYSLRLAARAADAEGPAGLVETAPLGVTTPAVPVEAGEVLRVHGWVHVPTPITGSLDGLVIIDSLGGEPLAERFGETSGWTEFTMYRAAAASGYLTITLELTGLGEAWIDDLEVQPVMIRRPR